MQEQQAYMWRALELAHNCLKSGDVPVGAVIVCKGEIVAEAYNTIERDNNPLAHAEINAINAAVQKTGYKHLLECEMYVTLEPCSMCAGAIVLARLPHLFYGASDVKTGACGSLYNIVEDSRLNHNSDVTKGILQKECSMLLQDFFKQLRKKKAANKR